MTIFIVSLALAALAALANAKSFDEVHICMRDAHRECEKQCAAEVPDNKGDDVRKCLAKREHRGPPPEAKEWEQCVASKGVSDCIKPPKHHGQKRPQQYQGNNVPPSPTPKSGSSESSREPESAERLGPLPQQQNGASFPSVPGFQKMPNTNDQLKSLQMNGLQKRSLLSDNTPSLLSSQNNQDPFAQSGSSPSFGSAFGSSPFGQGSPLDDMFGGKSPFDNFGPKPNEALIGFFKCQHKCMKQKKCFDGCTKPDSITKQKIRECKPPQRGPGPNGSPPPPPRDGVKECLDKVF